MAWGQAQYQKHAQWLNSVDPSGQTLSSYIVAHQSGMQDFEDQDGMPLCRGGCSSPVTAENAKWFSLFMMHQRFFGAARWGVLQAFRRGFEACGEQVFCALASMPDHELITRVESHLCMTAEMLISNIVVQDALGEEGTGHQSLHRIPAS